MIFLRKILILVKRKTNAVFFYAFRCRYVWFLFGASQPPNGVLKDDKSQTGITSDFTTTSLSFKTDPFWIASQHLHPKNKNKTFRPKRCRWLKTTATNLEAHGLRWKSPPPRSSSLVYSLNLSQVFLQKHLYLISKQPFGISIWVPWRWRWVEDESATMDPGINT